MSTGVPGDQADRFSPTVHFFRSHSNSRFLSVSLSRFDYCNALAARIPQVLLDKIQRLINCSARPISKALESACVIRLLFVLHWQPISSRIQYKIALVCFHIVSSTAPVYVSELLRLYSPCSCLRSASDTRIFGVPRVVKRNWGSFQYIGPAISSSLSGIRLHSLLLSQN